jgi:hypothetical protein
MTLFPISVTDSLSAFAFVPLIAVKSKELVEEDRPL